MNFQQKLNWVKSEYKTYNPDSFMVLKDIKTGWTDGYIADVVGMFRDVVQAKAQIKHSKGRMTRFIVDNDKGPEIKKVIPPKYTEVVNDLNPVLIDGMPRLAIEMKSKKARVLVNPSMVGYFLNTYTNVSFTISTEKNKAIRVEVDGELIGLIMPLMDR